MNDIDLSGENWTPIPQFWGTLDGNGHSIDNMTIRNEDSNNDYIAFIKEIKNKGVPVTIKNIKFKNVDIYSSGYYVACVLGDWGACKINMSNIAVESGTIIGNGMVGSLMSRTYDNTNIENCYSHVNINTLCQYDAGGFIGSYYLQYNYNIKNSYFDGTISGAWRVGPIKGSNENDNTEGSEKQYYTFTNLYYNSDNFTIKTTQNATGLTTSQFADQSNFAGWDFENTWIMKDGRPELRIFVKD